VRGRVLLASGAPAAGSRVVLRGLDVPSTVASTAADGTFLLLARGGSASFVVSPPPGSGLPQATTETSAALTIDESAPPPTLELRWNDLAAADLRVQVTDSGGRPAGGARILAQGSLGTVATLRVVRPDGSTADLPAAGSLRVDTLTAADGSAAFSRLPVGPYTLLVAPADATAGAITSAAVTVATGDASVHAVRLGSPVRLAGKLEGAGDLSGVRITATDVGTDVAPPPLVTTAAADGSFALPVSPRRRYLLVAQPPADSPFARTFLGGGAVEASSFVLRGRLPARLPFHGRVVDAQRGGVANTVVKVFCFPGAPGCPDATVPLAETVSGDDGSFDVSLPDPQSR
jgi:hypothetical protein